MSAELIDRAAQAVELARKAGADDVWATASRRRTVSFKYRDGSLEKVQDTTSRALAVQVYANGRYSTHQTTDLEPARLGEFLRETVATTAALEPDPSRQITPPDLFRNRPTAFLDLVDTQVHALDREQRIAWCRTLDAAARANERVISATSQVQDGSNESATASSNGFAGSEASTSCWFGAEVTLKDRGDRRAEDSFYAGGTHVEALPAAGEVAQVALGRALARLGADKGPTVKGTMVVDARAAASLVGRLLAKVPDLKSLAG